MLKGIDPVLSPELLKILAEMGHGDEIVLGDSNFPAASLAQRIVRADGQSAARMIKAIVSLIPLDYVTDFSAITMQCNNGTEPSVWSSYREILASDPEGSKPFLVLPKKDFYERASKAYCVVATGETEGFANVIVRKGVIRL